MKNILIFCNVIVKFDNIWNFIEIFKEGKFFWCLKNVFNLWNKLECIFVKFFLKLFYFLVLNGRWCYVIFKYFCYFLDNFCDYILLKILELIDVCRWE